MKLNRGQWIVVGVVTTMWVGTFFLTALTVESRVGAQAAFMLILGRLFAVGILRKEEERNGNGT